MPNIVTTYFFSLSLSFFLRYRTLLTAKEYPKIGAVGLTAGLPVYLLNFNLLYELVRRDWRGGAGR